MRFAPLAIAAGLLAGCGGSGLGGSATANGGSSTLPSLGAQRQIRAIADAAAFGVVDAAGGWQSFAPLTLTWPNGAPATGDMLVACAESQWQSAPQAPAGWTALSTTSANSFGSTLFYKVAGSSEPASVIFTIASHLNISASMVRIHGAATTAPLWSHVANHNSTVIATGAIVPNVVGMLPLACFGGVNATSYTFAAGWARDAQASGQYASSIGHRSTVTTDTTTGVSMSATDATSANTNDAYGVLVAPAVAATPAPTPPPTAPPATTLAVTDTASGWNSVAPVNLAWPKGAPSAGDLLVACVESQWQATPQTPAGWSALYAANSGFGSGLFYKIAGSAEPASVVFTIPTAFNISASMARIHGAATTAPLWSHAANHNSATIATAALVPNVAGMLPLACFGGVTATSYTFAAGWVRDAQVGGQYDSSIGHRSTVTTDTTTGISMSATTASVANTNDAYGVLVAPAVAATPAPTPPPTAPPTTPPATTLAVADTASGWNSVAPVSLAWPKGAPLAGDLLVACVESQWQATPQTPAGWNALYAADPGFGTGLFYKIAGSAEPASVVFAIPTAFNVSASMARISGAATSAPLWSHVATNSAATVATGALVPNVLGMLPLACVGGVNANGYTLATGWNLDSRTSGQYDTAIGHRTTVTGDTTTGISVTATASSTPIASDAYGLLIAPATATTPPPGGGIALNPSSIAFTSLTAPAQTVTATQTGNTSFNATSQNCSGIATIASTGAGTFSLGPVAVGSCSFTISGSNGKTATLPVTVTSTVIIVN